MPETAISNTEQTWPAWKKGAQIGLLAAGFLATFGLPIFLLHLATDALYDNRALADQYSAWSYGLVLLGPGLFVTSLLAMGSTLPALWRYVSRILAAGLAIYIYIQLGQVGKDFFIPVVLGILSVVYCWLADAFTPNSSGGEKIDDDSTEDDESVEAVVETEKPEASATSASLMPRSQASQVGSLLTPVVLLVVPVVAIVLDVRDLAVRNWRGATRKSR